MGFPAQATSLPSNFDVTPPCIGFPSPSDPSEVSLIPAAVVSNFSVWARIAFEPSCDFVALSFQLPTQLSAARACPANTVARTSTERHTKSFRIEYPLLERVLYNTPAVA